ncbi:hypothetical protein HZA33_03205 [Candidatus Pacearchaeota archaeon]|nr:hypothetical protein [Candidatus Pacearchaeota archaeon]
MNLFKRIVMPVALGLGCIVASSFLFYNQGYQKGFMRGGRAEEYLWQVGSKIQQIPIIRDAHHFDLVLAEVKDNKGNPKTYILSRAESPGGFGFLDKRKIDEESVPLNSYPCYVDSDINLSPSIPLSDICVVSLDQNRLSDLSYRKKLYEDLKADKLPANKYELINGKLVMVSKMFDIK